MKSVSFITPDPLDLRVLTTMGVSVKLGPNPIGKFGTGLKYALAICAKQGWPVKIETKTETGYICEYFLEIRKENIRGQEFERIYLSTQCNEQGQFEAMPLPFVTEYGAHWEPWMAFRELYSNTLDEGGTTTGEQGYPYPNGSTVIIVEGSEFHNFYLNRDEYFLPREPEAEEQFDDLEIREGETDRVFNRGIFVARFDYPLMHTYNVPTALDLTEDRTLRYSSEIDNRILSNTVRSTNREFIKKILMAPERNHESRLDFTYYMDRASSDFKIIVAELMEDEASRNHVNASVAKWWNQGKERERKRQSLGKRMFRVSLILPKEVSDETIKDKIEYALNALDDSSDIEIEIDPIVASCAYTSRDGTEPMCINASK